jgi:hypothetical protein
MSTYSFLTDAVHGIFKSIEQTHQILLLIFEPLFSKHNLTKCKCPPIYLDSQTSDFYIHLQFSTHAFTLRYFLFANSHVTNMKLF